MHIMNQVRSHSRFKLFPELISLVVVVFLLFPCPWAIKLLTMATEDDNKKTSATSDEEETKNKMADSAIGKKAQESPQQYGSSTDGPPAKAGPTKRQHSAALDLSTLQGSSPQGSKNRQTMKELLAEKARIKNEQNETSKKIRNETQRQKRLIDKASRLSNEELFEVFNQRRENQELFRAKAKAKAKPKAKTETGTD